MLLQVLEKIDGALLKDLCAEGCPESQTLEFKRDLPGNSDKDKFEVCKDVIALANADGGDLIYGIEERSGVASAIVPIQSEPPDTAMRRLMQVIDAGIEPRIQGLRCKAIEIDGGYSLLLRVQPSFDGPHCIRNNSNRRFVLRNGTGVTDMSFDQIRGAFDRTATLAEQARRFVERRRQLIAEGQTPVPLMSGAHLVVHLVPISGQAGRRTVDLRTIYAQSFTDLIHNGWGGCSRSFNLDGLVVHPGGRAEEGTLGYNHIFRNGALEGVELGGEAREVAEGVIKSIVWSLEMSRYFYETARKFLSMAKSSGFAGPALFGIGILNAKGYQLSHGGSYYHIHRAIADRLHLIPQDVWIEDLETVNLDATIRPLMDNLWQAFDMERCLDFDDATGAFKPRQR